jgi:hypothetical protein
MGFGSGIVPKVSHRQQGMGDLVPDGWSPAI